MKVKNAEGGKLPREQKTFLKAQKEKEKSWSSREFKLFDKPDPTLDEEIRNLKGLPGPAQGKVRALVDKADKMAAEGMVQSADRLKHQALVVVRRYRSAANKESRPMLGK
jgi:hypothetical protein